MSKVRIITTVDYEVFGNGSGDVLKCLIEPSQRLQAIAEEYGVPLTFMVDICEYWAFDQEAQKGNFPAQYDPARWMREQWSQFLQGNHDIQLHIHPQWLKGQYDPTGRKWELDMSRWRTSALSAEEAQDVLRKGKDTLESLLRPHQPDYSCHAFRAGAWCIQPEGHILRALRAAGFTVDTTAAYGCHHHDTLTSYDFRDVPRKPYWKMTDSLKDDAWEGLWEIPIATHYHGVLATLTRLALKRSKRISTRPPGCQGTTDYLPDRNPWNALLPRFMMLDICAMPAGQLLDAIEAIEKQHEDHPLVPVVLIGHAKSFNSQQNLTEFFERARSRGYPFTIFQEFLKELTATMTPQKSG